MPVSQQNPVVAGVDGSDNGARALDWAAREAARSHRPLRVVSVTEKPGVLARFGLAPDGASVTGASQRIVDAAVEHVRASHPGTEVSGAVLPGPRDRALVAESGNAHLMVVGSRGLGGVESLFAESVGAELAARGACPVVVVPENAVTAETTRVVVGTDCSEGSRAAVRLAFEQAATRGVAVRAVLAWESTAFAWPEEGDGDWPADQEPTVDRVRARLAEFLSGERAAYPDVPVEEVVVPGAAAPSLVQEGGGSDLLVVGSHGRGGIAEVIMGLGSVSHGVLRHSRCPVAVVPTRTASVPTGTGDGPGE
ncbi:universal stress protein [Actinorugispora endophytica]|uniref:Nucleotide-binding universal stress UspA family protein n=1 Tax=Actinorugispora endophytica TaxID=1605990 RepID=A0A4R6UXW4_9ACTN|nr:universal stress protein [Actinorugispora endophytica]TDQ52289.1 nucleotide-binding universal stress UspA family protein [Actinorugispora endophytica]